MKKTLFLISSVVVLALLLTACGVGNPFAPAPTPTSVPVVAERGALNVEGRVVPKTFSSLAFSVNGEIETLAVAEGDTVAEGSVLVGLGKREQMQAAVSSAKLEELAAQQALDMLRRKADLARTQAEETLARAEKALIEARRAVSDLDTDAYRDTLDDKETAVQNARDDLKDAQEELDKRKDLDPDNQVRKDAEQKVEDEQKKLDEALRDRDLWKNQKSQADANLAQAEAAYADAQKEVENRQNGPDPDELALAQARLDSARGAVQAAERALANMDLLAPFSGTVANLHDIALGQWIGAGRIVVTLADMTEWFVETKDLNELDVVDVEVGQKVVVRPDALEDLELAGEVTAIKPVYTERSGDVLYTVRIRLTESDNRLRWGMTVQVEFE